MPPPRRNSAGDPPAGTRRNRKRGRKGRRPATIRSPRPSRVPRRREAVASPAPARADHRTMRTQVKVLSMCWTLARNGTLTIQSAGMKPKARLSGRREKAASAVRARSANWCLRLRGNRAARQDQKAGRRVKKLIAPLGRAGRGPRRRRRAACPAGSGTRRGCRSWCRRPSGSRES